MAATIGTAQRFALASVCAVAVSTVYAIQPVLEVAGADLGLAHGAFGWLVAAGQVGYLLGLALLVPLGDLLDRRRLITGQLLLVALAAALTAVAPNAVIAAAGLVVAGCSRRSSRPRSPTSRRCPRRGSGAATSAR